MATSIRPKDLPEAPSIPNDTAIIVDTGDGVFRTTPQLLVAGSIPPDKQVQTVAELKERTAVEGDQFAVVQQPGAGTYTARLTGTFTTEEATAYALDDQEAVFVASTASAPLVFVRDYEFGLKPEMFAAYGSTTDRDECHLAIQKCLDVASALGGIDVSFTAAEYKTTYPFCHRSNVSLFAGNSVIQNTLTEAERVARGYIAGVMPFAVIYMGNLHPAYMPTFNGGGAGTAGGAGVKYFDWETTNNIGAGESYLTLDTIANAANYPAGSTVWVRSEKYWSQPTANGRNHLGLQIIMMQVKSNDPATGTIVFDKAFPYDITDPYIALSTSATDPSTGDPQNDQLGLQPLYICANAKVYGGTWISQPADGTDYLGNAFMTSAAYNCDIQPAQVVGQSPLGIQGSFCNVAVGTVIATRKMTELALGSTSNTIEIGRVIMDLSNTSISDDHLLKLGENEFNNSVRIRSFTHKGSLSSRYICYITSGSQSTVQFDSGKLTGTWGGIVYYGASDPNALGLDPNQSPTINDTITFNWAVDDTAASPSYHVYTGNDTVQADTFPSLRNLVVRGKFRSTPTAKSAVMSGYRPTLDYGAPAGTVRWSVASLDTPQQATVSVIGGSSAENYQPTGTTYASFNGNSLAGAPNAVTAAIGSTAGQAEYVPDMSKPVTAVEVSDPAATSIRLMALINSTVGAKKEIRIHNSTGATISVTTLTAGYSLNGATIPNIPTGQTLVLNFKHMYTQTGGRLKLAEPIPGPQS